MLRPAGLDLHYSHPAQPLTKASEGLHDLHHELSGMCLFSGIIAVDERDSCSTRPARRQLTFPAEQRVSNMQNTWYQVQYRKMRRTLQSGLCRLAQRGEFLERTDSDDILQQIYQL